jgi:hypothetical protein
LRVCGSQLFSIGPIGLIDGQDDQSKAVSRGCDPPADQTAASVRLSASNSLADNFGVLAAMFGRAVSRYNGKVNVSLGSIVLQNSKSDDAENLAKVDFFNPSASAKLSRSNTKVRGGFCLRRCGPSHRRGQNAPAEGGNGEF